MPFKAWGPCPTPGDRGAQPAPAATTSGSSTPSRRPPSAETSPAIAPASPRTRVFGGRGETWRDISPLYRPPGNPQVRGPFQTGGRWPVRPIAGTTTHLQDPRSFPQVGPRCGPRSSGLLAAWLNHQIDIRRAMPVRRTGSATLMVRLGADRDAGATSARVSQRSSGVIPVQLGVSRRRCTPPRERCVTPPPANPSSVASQADGRARHAPGKVPLRHSSGQPHPLDGRGVRRTGQAPSPHTGDGRRSGGRALRHGAWARPSRNWQPTDLS
ncbi:MAG: hypothetical protein JWP24_15 [Marmoricola sp.]|nr:hypothetical protein [Marmoricola sp.]